MADTQLTVADARSQLAQYVPNGSSEFLYKLNQAVERLTYSGKNKGSMISVVFTAASGIIILPPRYLAILAGKFDHFPVQSFSQWSTYMELGPCNENDTIGWYGRLQDLGDGYCVQTVPVESGPIRIYSTAPDDGIIVRLYGTDADTLQPVIDANGVEGEQVICSAPFVVTTHNFADLTGVQKELTKGPLQAKILPTNGDPLYQIAEWQSWETRPSYRAYRIGPATKTVRVLCQRRFIPLIAETDFVIPGSIGALKFALKALALEDAGYEAQAESQQCWNLAYEILNQEAKSLRGGNQVPIPTSVWGWGQGLPFSN